MSTSVIYKLEIYYLWGGDNYADPLPRPHETGGIYGNGIIVRRYAPGQVLCFQFNKAYFWSRRNLQVLLLLQLVDVEIELTGNYIGLHK